MVKTALQFTVTALVYFACRPPRPFLCTSAPSRSSARNTGEVWVRRHPTSIWQKPGFGYFAEFISGAGISYHLNPVWMRTKVRWKH